jgi:hypothetical protein
MSVREVLDRRTSYVDAMQDVSALDGPDQPLVRLDQEPPKRRARRPVDQRDGVDVADARSVVTGRDGAGDLESGNEAVDGFGEGGHDRCPRQSRVHGAG